MTTLAFALSSAAPFPLALAISAVVAIVAWRLRSLSLTGAAAAALSGTAALLVSWGSGALLISWFLLATGLSRIGKHRKAVLVADIVEKGSQRDALQVFANGGVFCFTSLLVILVTPECALLSECGALAGIVGAGALAAAGADTWATEVGTLMNHQPWSVRSRTFVPAGTSGAVSLAGVIATVAGALTLALLAVAFRVIAPDVQPVFAVALGGVAGASADTLLGAWLQERRWCPACRTETEQQTHRCGNRTSHHAGVSGLNNDVVNVLCTLTGALTATITVLL